MAKFTKKIVENSENFLIKKFIAEFKRKIKNKGKRTIFICFDWRKQSSKTL